MVKHIYLVRHGETSDNRCWVHQSIDIPLNERGKKEASAAAKVLSTLPIDTLLASDAERARETVASIVATFALPPRFEPVLRELHRSVLVEGAHHLSWRSIRGAVIMLLRAGDSSWHFGNGENVIEFRNRLKRVLALLADAPGETIVVVTHRGIINGLRFCIAHGFEGSPQAFILGAVLGRTANGSITELTYDPSRAAPYGVWSTR